MNENEIDKCCSDTSSAVTFNIGVNVENGRLSPEQRKLVASIVSRAVVTLTLSLERVVEQRFETTLQKRSSAHGIVDLDTGMTDAD